MKILNRYIAKHIIVATGAVLAVLLSIQSFITLAAQLKDVGKGDFTWTQVALFVPMVLPSDLYQLFPMAALLGCLLGLGRLDNHSELVVMRSAGLSLLDIAKTVLMTALLMLVVMTTLGEWVAPKLRDVALDMKSTAITQGQMLQTKKGVWLKEGDQFIHVATIQSKTNLEDITLYQLDAHQQLTTSRYAKRAEWDAQQQQWVFYQVDVSQFTPERVESHHYAQQTWPVALNIHWLTRSKLDPNQQTLHRLYRYLQFREASGLGQSVYAFAFWKRVFQPVATLVMIFLAIPFIFGPMQRSTNALRLVVGILVGFGFYIVNQFFGPMSQVYQIPPALAALLPSLLFVLVGWGLVRVRA